MTIYNYTKDIADFEIRETVEELLDIEENFKILWLNDDTEFNIYELGKELIGYETKRSDKDLQ